MALGQSLPEKRHPRERDEGAGPAKRRASRRPAVDRSDADAGQVQESRRDDEADAVEQPVRAGGELGSVRMPVEDREESDQGRGDGELWLRLEEDRRAEADRGERDTYLDAGQVYAHETERSTERHDHRERDREKPH